MSTASRDNDLRRPFPDNAATTTGLQAAVDAATGDPRTGEEPAPSDHARQPSAASASAADEHRAPAAQPSADNTDRRA